MALTDRKRNKNPWLTIPSSDYEGHMNSPNVGQLRFLSEVFRKMLSDFNPKRIAVIGCATGNGFEHFDFDIIQRVVAIDINPEYISVLRKRYSKHTDKIATICSDVNACEFEPESFDMIHGACIFEYIDPLIAVRNMSRWLARNGVLTVVLQLPDKTLKPVSDTPFTRLKKLDRIMKFVSPQEFNAIALSENLVLNKEENRQLKSGKEFYISTYSPKPRTDRSDLG